MVLSLDYHHHDGDDEEEEDDDGVHRYLPYHIRSRVFSSLIKKRLNEDSDAARF